MAKCCIGKSSGYPQAPPDMTSHKHETETKTLFPGVAVVTGAAGTGTHSHPERDSRSWLHVGIGNAVALAFAESGSTKIAITDRNDALLSQTASTITTNFLDVDIYSTVSGISSERFVNSFIEGVLERFSRVDYCVNCASILSNNENSTETSIEEFGKINKVNCCGCWLTSRAELETMPKQEPLPSYDWSLLTNLIVASGLGIYTSSPLTPSTSLPACLCNPLPPLLSPSISVLG